MKKSAEMQSYLNNGNKMHYFNVIGANEDKLYEMRIYQKAKFRDINVGRSYKIIDAVHKGGDKYWVVASSLIAFTPVVNVKEGPLPHLPEDAPTGGTKRKLADAQSCDDKSTVKGKIVQV